MTYKVYILLESIYNLKTYFFSDNDNLYGKQAFPLLGHNNFDG